MMPGTGESGTVQAVPDVAVDLLVGIGDGPGHHVFIHRAFAGIVGELDQFGFAQLVLHVRQGCVGHWGPFRLKAKFIHHREHRAHREELGNHTSCPP